jgi:hypothetical protein
VDIATAGPRGGEGTRVVLVDGAEEGPDGGPDTSPAPTSEPASSEGTVAEEAAERSPDVPSHGASTPAAIKPPDAPQQQTAADVASPSASASAPPVVAAVARAENPSPVAAPNTDIPPPELTDPSAASQTPQMLDNKPIESALAQAATTLVATSASAIQRAGDPATAAVASVQTPANELLESTPTSHAVSGPRSRIYALRMSHDHVRVAEQHGGSEETEAAVGAALKFLAENQSVDGRWNPRAFGAGRQSRLDGPDRQGVGSQADTGITGLCLLSLLAAGHTHLEGEYSEQVRHGLEFLLGSQAADGNLSGAATLYERMYCHGMAGFALSEAYAMTGDERLQPAVNAAVQYTLRALRPGAGGWRYQPGEPGDMSQFGWQAMALKSAQLGGIKIPDESRAEMRKFLDSVSSGRQGGLAGYRPGHPATRPMTAEALVCRQFIGQAQDDPKSREAGEFLLKELPGAGERNVYYWYYGTLGMYQLQGEYWRAWNGALQASLLASQRRDGGLAGSWDPDSVWGGYGGRAFSTALSALCLEVYYRFLPLYAAHGEVAKP